MIGKKGRGAGHCLSTRLIANAGTALLFYRTSWLTRQTDRGMRSGSTVGMFMRRDSFLRECSGIIIAQYYCLAGGGAGGRDLHDDDQSTAAKKMFWHNKVLYTWKTNHLCSAIFSSETARTIDDLSVLFYCCCCKPLSSDEQPVVGGTKSPPPAARPPSPPAPRPPRSPASRSERPRSSSPGPWPPSASPASDGRRQSCNGERG